MDAWLDPANHVSAASGDWIRLVVAGGLSLFALLLNLFVMKRMRRHAHGRSRLGAWDFVVGVGLALAVLIGPAAAAAGFGDMGLRVLAIGVTQVVLTLAGLAALSSMSKHPRYWVHANVGWAKWMPVVWVLNVFVVGGALAFSVILWSLLGVDVVEQSVANAAGSASSVLDKLGWFVAAGLGAPFAEEFVFRLVLFELFRQFLAYLAKGDSDDQSVPVWATVIAGTLSISLFVGVHSVFEAGQGYTAIPLAILALELTVLMAFTRSFWASVALHAMYNSSVLAMKYFVLAG